MGEKGKGKHNHNVGRLERDNAPRRRKYALFIGQYHTGKFIYCLEDRCGKMSIHPPGLLTILSQSVGCSGGDKEGVLSAFRTRYWVIDMFASKDKARPYSKTGSARGCIRQVGAIWEMIKEEKGVAPTVVIPAMKSAPSSCDAYYRKRRLKPTEQPFGVKMFSAIERHPQLGPVFEPVFMSPWRAPYKRQVRRILKSHGLVARPDRGSKKNQGGKGRLGAPGTDRARVLSS